MTNTTTNTMNTSTTTNTNLSSSEEGDIDLKQLADVYQQTQSMASLHKACEAKIQEENLLRIPPRPASHAILLMNKVARKIAEVQPHSDIMAIYTQWRDSHSRFAHRKEFEGRKRELMVEEDETDAYEHVTTTSKSIRERISKKRMSHYEEEETFSLRYELRTDSAVIPACRTNPRVQEHEELVEEGLIFEHDYRTPEMQHADTFEPTSVEKVRICPDIEFMHGKLGLIADIITVHVTRFLQLQLQSIGNIRVMAVMEQRKKMNGRLKADLSKGWDCASILKLALNCHRSLRFQGSYLNPHSVFQLALNVRHTTFAHSDPLILDMEDLLYAAIVGIQIAEVIGAPKMYELLIQHEFQIISHMGGAKQLPHKSLRISLSCLQVSEKLSTIIPLLSVERRDEVLEVLEDLIRKVVSREVARVSGSVTKIDLERERICDLLEFLQNRSEELRVVGPNSHRVQAVLNGLLSCKHPAFNNTRQSVNFDGNEMLLLCHQTAECLSLFGCLEEHNRLKVVQRSLFEEMGSALRLCLRLEGGASASSLPPLSEKPNSTPVPLARGANNTSDIFRLSDLFHQLAQTDTRFSIYRGRVRTACLKKDEYIINLLLYFEQKRHTEALLEDLEQWK